MSQRSFEPESVDELPAQLAVFPLPGATLLPGTQLPLNIFEPRYLNMVLDALGGVRMIGMVQPLTARPGSHDLYGVGCAGRIVSFSEASDGRLLITLRGVCRYRLGEELSLRRGYRQVVPVWTEFAADLQTGPPLEHTIAQLRGALHDYLRVKDVRVDWDGLGQVATAKAVDFLAMNLPFTAAEKQALIEANNAASRWQALLAIAQMASTSVRQDSGAIRH